MKKAVIFDLNGVLLRGQTLEERFEEKGVSSKVLQPALDGFLKLTQLPNAGAIFSYWKFYLEKWGIKMGEQEFINFWSMPEREVPEMVAIARELKAKGMQLFALSNNFTERASYYKKVFPFLAELFEEVYFSGEIGYAKPDKRAFEHVLKENNLKPEDVIYFDDSARNVTAAKEMGIESYLFTGGEVVREKIK